MIKAYKTQLNPTKEQIVLIEKHLVFVDMSIIYIYIIIKNNIKRLKNSLVDMSLVNI